MQGISNDIIGFSLDLKGCNETILEQLKQQENEVEDINLKNANNTFKK